MVTLTGFQESDFFKKKNRPVIRILKRKYGTCRTTGDPGMRFCDIIGDIR